MADKKNQMSEEQLDKVSGGVREQYVLDLDSGKNYVQYGLSPSEYEEYKKFRDYEEIRKALENLKKEWGFLNYKNIYPLCG